MIDVYKILLSRQVVIINNDTNFCLQGSLTGIFCLKSFHWHGFHAIQYLAEVLLERREI